ncbi:MAG: chordopoxvirus fusion protein [Desulfomonilaceae bacterium]
MIDTLRIFNELKEAIDPVAAEKIADAVGAIYEELRFATTKPEFNELKDVVTDLAQAQLRTEERLVELIEAQKRTEARVEELAEAQKRTEKRVEELAQAQKRTEARVEELAEAQKRTEKRVEELAQAQKVTEERVDALAVAVTRLERKVEDLVGEMKVIKQELGGLAHTVGYRLEDEAIKSLPSLLSADHAVQLEGPLIRDFFEMSPKKYIELNIWGRGLQRGEHVEIIGEAKSQLKKRDVDSFLQTLKSLAPFIQNRILPVIITYQTSPQVRQYARAKGIHLYFSYQL